MTLTLPRFLFLNGPPGSGKSTLAWELCRAEPLVWRESFAEPIRQMLWAVWYPDNDPIRPFPDLRDALVKSSPMPFASSLSMPDDSLHFWSHREEMIAFSEEYMKPRYGQEIFGKLLLRRCEAQSPWYSHFVIDDSGFEPEATEIINAVGAQNCALVRLHRKGCTFQGDSRSYISLPIESLDLPNNGAPSEMLDALQLKFGTL